MTTIDEDAEGASLHDLLVSVNAAWEGMLADSSPVTRRLRIADTDIEVALVGEELATYLLPGLEWHAEATGPVSATVGAWDAQATGRPLPPPIATADPRALRWIVRHEGRPMAGADWSAPGMLRIGNRYARHHLLGVANTAVLHAWEVGAPLRRQLWWALGPEVLFAHAAAVGDAEGAALIMGSAGAGKSSTALACLCAGMGFVSDDYCLIRDDPPVVHLLAATARVHHHELAHLDLGDIVVVERVPRADDKALMFLHHSVPDRLVRSAPVRVVLLPELGDERSARLRPVSPAAALRTVAPAALKQMHVDPAQELAQLRALLSTVPAYRLRLSCRREANAEAVQEALELASRSM